MKIDFIGVLDQNSVRKIAGIPPGHPPTMYCSTNFLFTWIFREHGLYSIQQSEKNSSTRGSSKPDICASLSPHKPSLHPELCGKTQDPDLPNAVDDGSRKPARMVQLRYHRLRSEKLSTYRMISIMHHAMCVETPMIEWTIAILPASD